MKQYIARQSLLLVILSVVSLLLFFSVGCEPGGEVTFQNQRNEDIKVFVTHVREDGSTDGFADYGTIPGQSTKTISITFLGDEWVNRIEIRDTRGSVIISHDYKMGDLEMIGWKIVIPP